MATASSAQREPSMEEILASIRRIIEDSDTGRKQPADAAELRQDLAPPPTPVPVPEIEAFRSELQADAAPKKPVTLAEVQAQLAATDPVVAVAPRPEPARMPPAPTTLAEVGARVAAHPSASVVTNRPAEPPQNADSIVADWRRDVAAIGGSAAAEKTPTPEAAPEVEIEDDELPELTAAETGASSSSVSRASADSSSVRPSILSEHTGRQVAAAFGELSDAFANRSRKSFDEMAEEMLRPMLQDWLDNNLPTLVERLVREEIERVARGAQ
ncbi:MULTISPECIES: PopZ family protein [unclassified Mesorhizobium]|uniref:PopZ family protein n=1 Tax=unclassified Mesorhizobium TaxID=325217 RepID=UPI000BB008D6|nr:MULTISPECIES: PopZ family protein [unclassified Mesorhizobium]TGT59481.1 DUF2497 domain-containing protein [Mesorhizobium sp. M00.F.Ca.ET.170.01.1.1]AZO12475.1 DUF2497 domain-containing protein [Mesorhizobium sp. M3A.F.Ca.ET.080.04.2.1]PBB85969.1 hypothetical protein CK216_15305 [Mesorhizobium sp. WSM3876]RWB68374.1 MAG: DUF2497 domain-containing protein [Mesorhizobium sp.]RWB85868.1 MAG: DUF2497 domain-containing protein [Mesorhizobium sp.]